MLSPNRIQAETTKPINIIVKLVNIFNMSLIETATVSNNAPKLGNCIVKMRKKQIEIKTVVIDEAIVKLSVISASDMKLLKLSKLILSVFNIIFDWTNTK